MPSPKNLKPGQYQIGDLVFGRGTLYPVSSVEIQAYNINAKDSQVIQSDEIRFGQDNFVPAPIVFEIGVDDNYALPNMEGLTGRSLPGIDANKYALHALAKEWRGDDVKGSPGQTKPLYCCERDGRVLMIYGRPRKFQHSKRSRHSQFFTVTAEFMRGDTLAYDADEQIISLTEAEDISYVTRASDPGDAPAWFRVLCYGPLDHPVITIGMQQIELDYNIAEGEIVEISSYPWMRRAISSNGLNLSARLIGETQYLDRLRLPAKLDIPVRWTSNDLNTWAPLLDSDDWVVSIDDINQRTLPNSFTTIAGKVVVRFDLFNFDFGKPPNKVWDPSKFLGSGIFGTTSACIYNRMQYKTRRQYCQARVTEPFSGSSAIVIMSDEDMTSYVALQVESGIGGLGNNRLRIRSGTAYNASTVRATWDNPASFGWAETDRVAIEYNPDNCTYYGYVNGEEKLSWSDGQNTIQKITITGNPDDGIYQLNWNGSGPTVPIAVDTQETTIRDALEALPNIGVDDVLVTGEYPEYFVTFRNGLGAANQPLLTVTGKSFVGGTAPDVTVDLVQAGSPAIVPTGANNRSQGFIFDLDGDLSTIGTGFREIVAYDKSLPRAGGVFLLWRDAFTVIA